MRQKLFGFGMLAVVLVFIAASVAVPTVQALLASGAEDLPFGLADTRDLVYWATIGLGLVVLFGALCITYFAVPKGVIPWSCVWPGALGATIAIGLVDAIFPVYLSNISTLRIGTSAVFVLIALVWFYVLALIVLAGAVVNELRFEALRRPRKPPMRRNRPLPRLHPSLRHRLRPRRRARVGPMARRARASRRHRAQHTSAGPPAHRTGGPKSIRLQV